jgi:HEPN domain-containing protein
MSSPGRRPVETPREWLRFAQEDLMVAEWAIRDDLPAYHTICFLCQSAAEKSLKGYLVSRGWQLQKTHDVVALLGLCAEYDPIWAHLVPAAAILNEYIVAGRYPGDLAAYDVERSDAEEALHAARCIVAQARELTGVPLDGSPS